MLIIVTYCFAKVQTPESDCSYVFDIQSRAEENCHMIAVCLLYILLIQGESLARGPKLLSMYTVEQRGFLVRKYWQTGSFKAFQTAFRTEFGERRAPSKCCVQKLV